MNFEDFNLHPDVLAGVKAQGYETPTPIQTKAIPPIMEGRDLIGLAQTGTGKTAAFVLPILHRLIDRPRGSVRALIISPTRELAEQTCETINTLGQETGLKGISVYGGVSMFEQTRKLTKGVELVVGCPGRLLDHLLKGSLDLSDIEVLIIDEADRLFDMGFLPDIRKIVRCIMKEHQTLLFSATMADDIMKLVQEVLHNPLTVKIGHSAPADTVSHALYPVKPHLKTMLLKEILRTVKTDSVIIFTRTKRRVDRLTQQLKRDGYNVAKMQGNMTQYQRQEALDGFKYGDLKILVATDIAARGLDILSISHVINYDMPDTTDAYTHRIGRTGRINNNGEAYTLVTNEDKDMIKALERLFKKPIETRTLPDFDYNAPDPGPGDSMPARATFRGSKRKNDDAENPEDASSAPHRRSTARARWNRTASSEVAEDEALRVRAEKRRINSQVKAEVEEFSKTVTSGKPPFRKAKPVSDTSIGSNSRRPNKPGFRRTERTDAAGVEIPRKRYVSDFKKPFNTESEDSQGTTNNRTIVTPGNRNNGQRHNRNSSPFPKKTSRNQGTPRDNAQSDRAVSDDNTKRHKRPFKGLRPKNDKQTTV